MTKHVEGYFLGAGIGQIFWQGWVPEDPRAVSGVVVVAHGAAEHSGRYAHVGERFADAGYATYALDHRGHGRSEGVRANIGRMSEVLADLDQLVRQSARDHDGVPVFLLGHSMGGLIALDYVTDPGFTFPLAGLILSGPAVESEVGSPVQRAAAKVLSAVAPNLGVLALDASAVSKDPAVVAAYDADPLVYRKKLRARTGAEMLDAMSRVKARLSDIAIPVLVMHGTEDRLTAPAGSRAVAEGVGTTDITLKLYEGLYHEIFNEPEQDSVFGDVLTWLKVRG